MSDPLERLFQRLVTNVAALDPAALDQSFPIVDVYERLVPYRTHRAVLGVDASEDYDMLVLRLLAGERGYASVTPEEVRGAFARETEAVNPDTGVFRQFPDALILLDPDRVARILDRESAAIFEAEITTPRKPGRPERDPAPPVAEAAAPADRDDLPFMIEDAEPPPESRPREPSSGGAVCSYCGGVLPVGRAVLFCPHCGQNIGVAHCSTCGAELDLGWRFCVTCGQKATGLG